MARMVVASFNALKTANDAVRELVDAGFPRENIKLFSDALGTAAVKPSGQNAGVEPIPDGGKAGAGVGAGSGFAIGVAAGLTAGFGAVPAAWITPYLTTTAAVVLLAASSGAIGALAGGFTGRLLGAVIGIGIPEEEAQHYARGVRRGGVVVRIQADEYSAGQVIGYLERYHPDRIENLPVVWQDRGLGEAPSGD